MLDDELNILPISSHAAAITPVSKGVPADGDEAGGCVFAGDIAWLERRIARLQGEPEPQATPAAGAREAALLAESLGELRVSEPVASVPPRDSESS